MEKAAGSSAASPPSTRAAPTRARRDAAAPSRPRRSSCPSRSGWRRSAPRGAGLRPLRRGELRVGAGDRPGDELGERARSVGERRSSGTRMWKPLPPRSSGTTRADPVEQRLHVEGDLDGLGIRHSGVGSRSKRTKSGRSACPRAIPGFMSMQPMFTIQSSELVVPTGKSTTFSFPRASRPACEGANPVRHVRGASSGRTPCRSSVRVPAHRERPAAEVDEQGDLT